MGQFSFTCEECGDKEQFDWTREAVVCFEITSVKPALPTPLDRVALPLPYCFVCNFNCGGARDKNGKLIPSLFSSLCESCRPAYEAAAAPLTVAEVATMSNTDLLKLLLVFKPKLHQATSTDELRLLDAINSVLPRLQAGSSAVAIQAVALRELLSEHLRTMERAASEDDGACTTTDDGKASTNAEWEVGYRFFVKGEYTAYGSVDIKGAPASVDVSHFSDRDSAEKSTVFTRGGSRIWARARSVRCFGACYAPEDQTQKFRHCAEDLRGETIYTEMPSTPSSSRVAPLAYTAAEFGEMLISEMLMAARSEDRCAPAARSQRKWRDLEIRLQVQSTPASRREWVRSLIDAFDLSPLRSLIRPEGGGRTSGTFQELLDGTGLFGAGMDTTAPAPLVYAARQHAPSVVRELLDLGATRGRGEALRVCQRALPAFELAFNELNFAPDAPGAVVAAEHFELLAAAEASSEITTGGEGVDADIAASDRPVKLAKTERHATLVAAEAAVDRCTDCIALLSTAVDEWAATVAQLQIASATLRAAKLEAGYEDSDEDLGDEHLPDGEAHGAPASGEGHAATASAEAHPASEGDTLIANEIFVEQLLLSAQKAFGARTASKLRGTPMLRAKRCLDKLHAANVLAAEGSFSIGWGSSEETRRLRKIATAAPRRCAETSSESEAEEETPRGRIGMMAYNYHAGGLPLHGLAAMLGLSMEQLQMAVRMGM